MANKFLGLDSVNVLKQYIDEQLAAANINTRVITVQAYAYYKDGTTPITPIGGGFDTEAILVIYPEGWYSLKSVLNSLEDVDKALSEGSIWMTVGVVEGTNSIEWSLPMKVSGQNGVSVKFQYSHDKNALEAARYENPLGVDSEHRVEYVWTKTGDNDWVGPAIWAMYSKDAREILWRWKVTSKEQVNENGVPIQPDKPQAGETGWMSNIATMSLSVENPYLWMSYQIVPSEGQPSDSNWTEPILFGHWGRDGSVPDYTQTLYHKGLSNGEVSDIEGIVAPSKPTFIENGKIEDYIKDGWVELPEDDDYIDRETGDVIIPTVIWWQCTIKVDGRTNKVISEDSIGAVKRYNAVDGTAKAGQFTMNLYAWSETQNQPEMGDIPDNGWKPVNYDYLPDRPITLTSPEASLWMITANISGLDADGKPIVNGSWSEPVKLSGPRGPISYDYRIETRYNIGTSDRPKETPDEAQWFKEIPEITSQYPYIWAVNYLVCYKMKYGELNEVTGEYDIVQDGENGKVIEEYDYYRLSGINGENGNRKNTVKYSDIGESISVKSFSAENLYISNSTNDVTYNIELDTLTFINGYTGKFANIGTGNITINGGDFKLVGSGIETSNITLLPQETVELVCYNKDSKKVLLVIGKDISK